MKKGTKIKAILLAVLIALECMLSGCSGFSLFKPTVKFDNEYEFTLKVGETRQLNYEMKNGEGVVNFYNSDTNIVSVSQDGLVTALKEGMTGVDIVVTFAGEENTEISQTLLIHVEEPEEESPETEYIEVTSDDGNGPEKAYFDVSYETESYCKPGETIKLNAAYINTYGCKISKMTWTSENEKIATVDENGNVKGKAEGTAVIRAYCDAVGKYFDFTVTVLPRMLNSALQGVVDNHNSNAKVVYNLGIGSGTPEYYYDIVNSVNNMFFADLVRDETYYDVLQDGEKNDGQIDKIEYITVHYTGNMHDGADADNNADYFNYLGYTASIHYVTGRTNLSGSYSETDYRAFAVLNEKYAGWHASGYGLGPHLWLETGVNYSKDDPEEPVITVSHDGYYTINGQKTTVEIPYRTDGTTISGPTFMYVGSLCKTINDQGISWKVENGKYYLGNTYWGTQQYGWTLSNIGGNYTSIGIESCVDIGSNLVHTWHVTAQLCAQLMVKYDLDITRIQGHHFFSGKDCPQPMLENDGELWDMFIEYVQAEYDLITKYKNFDINWSIEDSGYGALNEMGLLTQDEEPHCVTYSAEVTVMGVKKTITLATIVESNLKCTEERISLQALGSSII